MTFDGKGEAMIGLVDDNESQCSYQHFVLPWIVMVANMETINITKITS